MLNGLYNTLIPGDDFHKDVITYSHAKNAISSSIIACIATPVFAWIYYAANFPLAAYVILTVGVVYISSSLLLKFVPLFIVRNIMVGSLYFCLLWLSYNLGGITSPPTYWFILLPLLAIILGSIFSGFFWAFIAFFTVIMLYLIEYSHYPLPRSPISDPLYLQGISICGLILIILGLAYFFEKNKREAAQEIQDINKLLKSSNEKTNLLFKKAIESSRLKSDFLANMSHELHNPINAIIGFTQLMKTKKIDPSKYNEHFNDILISAHHLSQMVTDMLDVSNFEFGTHLIQTQVINPTVIVKGVKDIFHNLIVGKKQIFDVEIDENLGNLKTDPVRLKQILFHTISNAIKFTPDNGKISVRIFPVGNEWFKIEVIDTGIGIREEDLSKLFVPFRQLDSSMSKKYPGMGIGLALIKRIVDAQGGEIDVTSQFGKGSTFSISLPRIPKQ